MRGGYRTNQSTVNVMCIDVRELLRRANAYDNQCKTRDGTIDELTSHISKKREWEHRKLEENTSDEWIRGTRANSHVLPPLSPADPVVIEEILHNPHPLNATTHKTNEMNKNFVFNAKTKDNNVNNGMENLANEAIHTSFQYVDDKSKSADDNRIAQLTPSKDGNDDEYVREAEAINEVKFAANIFSRTENVNDEHNNSDRDKLASNVELTQYASNTKNVRLPTSMNALPLTTLLKMTNILHSYNNTNTNNSNCENDDYGNSNMRNQDNKNYITGASSWGDCPFIWQHSSLPINSYSTTNSIKNKKVISAKMQKEDSLPNLSTCTENKGRSSEPSHLQKSKFVQRLLRESENVSHSINKMSNRDKIRQLRCQELQQQKQQKHYCRRWRDGNHDVDANEHKNIPRSLLWMYTENKQNITPHKFSRRPKQR